MWKLVQAEMEPVMLLEGLFVRDSDWEDRIRDTKDWGRRHTVVFSASLKLTRYRRQRLLSRCIADSRQGCLSFQVFAFDSLCKVRWQRKTLPSPELAHLSVLPHKGPVDGDSIGTVPGLWQERGEALKNEGKRNRDLLHRS